MPKPKASKDPKIPCIDGLCGGDVVVTARVQVGGASPVFKSACIGHIPLLCEKLLSVHNSISLSRPQKPG